MKKKGYIVLLSLSLHVRAQDAQFSQFFVSSSYLNPAFAGETKDSKIVAQNRLQWPSLLGGYKTLNIAYDQNIRRFNGGMGLLFTQSKAGSANYRFTNISLLYAQGVQLNQNTFARVGIQLGESIRDINVNDLTFGSQLYNGGNVPDEIAQSYQTKTFFDIASGLLIYTKKTWIGFSGHHLNKPNESLLQSESRLPVKYSVHGGFRYTVKKIKKEEQDLVCAFNYKSQAAYDQLDLGIYYDRKPVVIGAWYRGIPLLKYYQYGYQNNDALVFMLGYSAKGFRLGYSYDLTISKLYGNTLGAHELSVIFEFVNTANSLNEDKRKLKNIPCPSF